jgi:hypothetical protein
MSTTWKPERQRPPVASMSADELHAELVLDAVRYHPTALVRLTTAVNRIAALRRMSEEDTFIAIHDEVVALTGNGMPVQAS